MKARITQNGITCEFNLPFWRCILCKLGLHKWRYFRMAKTFEDIFPDNYGINRQCLHCKWMECTDDGIKFKGRL